MMQVSLTGFIGDLTPTFMQELQTLLLSAQSEPNGIPKELVKEKMSEKDRMQKLIEEQRKKVALIRKLQAGKATEQDPEQNNKGKLRKKRYESRSKSSDSGNSKGGMERGRVRESHREVRQMNRKRYSSDDSYDYDDKRRRVKHYKHKRSDYSDSSGSEKKYKRIKRGKGRSRSRSPAYRGDRASKGSKARNQRGSKRRYSSKSSDSSRSGDSRKNSRTNRN